MTMTKPAEYIEALARRLRGEGRVIDLTGNYANLRDHPYVGVYLFDDGTFRTHNVVLFDRVWLDAELPDVPDSATYESLLAEVTDGLAADSLRVLLGYVVEDHTDWDPSKDSGEEYDASLED